MKILLLGGTSDARRIAAALIDKGHSLVYSVAGLVRTPALECEVISGGFAARGGLSHYLETAGFEVLIDATHPYAQRISATALASCKALGLPCYRFDRPAWQAQQGWHHFDALPKMIEALAGVSCALLTTGQLSQGELDRAASLCQRVIYRTAAAPSATLADNVTWIKAIGPFDAAGERALMQQYGVEVLLSKNAGGAATQAKLHAAQALGVAVYMLARPVSAQDDACHYFTEIAMLLQAFADIN